MHILKIWVIPSVSVCWVFSLDHALSRLWETTGENKTKSLPSWTFASTRLHSYINASVHTLEILSSAVILFSGTLSSKIRQWIYRYKGYIAILYLWKMLFIKHKLVFSFYDSIMHLYKWSAYLEVGCRYKRSS